MNKQGTDQSVQMQMMICAMHNSEAKTRFAQDKVYIRHCGHITTAIWVSSLIPVLR